MNRIPIKKTLLAATASLIIAYVLDVIISLSLMSADYAALGPVLRVPEELQRRLWIGLIVYALYYLLFAALFARLFATDDASPAVDRSPLWTRLARGLGFGLFMALLFSVPTALMQYVYYPLPFSLALKWIASGFAVHAVSGLVVATILHPR